MKSLSSVWFFFLGITLLLACIVGLASQWRDTMLLRADLELARGEVAELDSLRVENQRLLQKQIPASELAALRADHQALLQLEAELDSLKKTGATKSH